MRILIVVEGGNVQNVLADTPGAEIEIIDFDLNPMSISEKDELFFQKLEEYPVNLYN